MSLARSTASGVNETLRMKWRHLSGRARLDSEIKVEAMKVVPLPSACFARRILGRGGWGSSVVPFRLASALKFKFIPGSGLGDAGWPELPLGRSSLSLRGASDNRHLCSWQSLASKQQCGSRSNHLASAIRGHEGTVP
jgi:hypothetical protein